MQIDFENYSIAPIHHKDAWRICDFMISNTDRFKAYFPATLKQNLTPTLAEIFVEKKVEEFNKKEEFLFTVKENTNRAIIGLVYVKELQKKEKQGELAYCIGYPYEGKGITSKMIDIIIKWSFKKANLDTLQIIAHKTNVPSVKIALKHNFIWIKTLPKSHQTFDKKFVDMELYELQKKNWLL